MQIQIPDAQTRNVIFHLLATIQVFNPGLINNSLGSVVRSPFNKNGGKTAIK